MIHDSRMFRVGEAAHVSVAGSARIPASAEAGPIAIAREVHFSEPATKLPPLGTAPERP